MVVAGLAWLIYNTWKPSTFTMQQRDHFWPHTGLAQKKELKKLLHTHQRERGRNGKWEKILGDHNAYLLLTLLSFPHNHYTQKQYENENNNKDKERKKKKREGR